MFFISDIPLLTTIFDLKLLIRATILKTSLPIQDLSLIYDLDAYYLLYNGRKLENTVVLQSVPHLLNGHSLILYFGNPGRDGNPNLNADFVFLRDTNILLQNFHECVLAAQRNREPHARPLWVESPWTINPNPSTADYGALLEDLSRDLLTWSNCLSQLGLQLQEDSALPNDRNSDVFQMARRRIQNNMDACRYLAPALYYISRHKIIIRVLPQ